MAIMLLFAPLNANAVCNGTIINPITDLCWSCLFPITIGGVQVSVGTDAPDMPSAPSLPVCSCPIPSFPFIRLGVPIGFWEPTRLAETVREPFCFPSLGGLNLGNGIGWTIPTGSRKNNGETSVKSFYQEHWMINPLLYILNFLTDIGCVQAASFDVAYMTELDPMWNDDELSVIINPEALIFGNPIAQAACAADCASSTVGLPLDPLFWCAGCQGGVYPFTGTVTDHVGGVMASTLLTEKMIAKLHREFLLWGSSGVAGLCSKYPMPIVKKTQYRLQILRPWPQITPCCQPYGRTEAVIAAGREYPVTGEDYVYQIWQKRDCCAL